MLIKDIINESEKIAPIDYSLAAVQKGYYDNSGLLINSGNCQTQNVLFALDLSKNALEKAKKVNAGLIFTHHPVIYKPIKRVGGLYYECAASGVSVYSAHLNLDIASGGIEDGLSSIFGAKNAENIVPLEPITDGRGFGRKFEIEQNTFASIIRTVSEKFCLKNYMAFGDRSKAISKIATFCGAGLSEELVGTDADLLVSADIPHHVLLAALENEKCVLQLTHYASEAFAFKNYAQKLCEKLKIKAHFYLDERFL